MGYTCQDCSYKVKKSTKNLSCPACGSYKLVSEKREQEFGTDQRNGSTTRLIILIVLWSGLITHIYDKLYN
jgi:DNA-directed RNA polymerase subunit RPC12/RpoP